jgi:hypothetical protein
MYCELCGLKIIELMWLEHAHINDIYICCNCYENLILNDISEEQ